MTFASGLLHVAWHAFIADADAQADQLALQLCIAVHFLRLLGKAERLKQLKSAVWLLAGGDL